MSLAFQIVARLVERLAAVNQYPFSFLSVVRKVFGKFLGKSVLYF